MVEMWPWGWVGVSCAGVVVFCCIIVCCFQYRSRAEGGSSGGGEGGGGRRRVSMVSAVGFHRTATAAVFADTTEILPNGQHIVNGAVPGPAVKIPVHPLAHHSPAAKSSPVAEKRKPSFSTPVVHHARAHSKDPNAGGAEPPLVRRPSNFQAPAPQGSPGGHARRHSKSVSTTNTTTNNKHSSAAVSSSPVANTNSVDASPAAGGKRSKALVGAPRRVPSFSLSQISQHHQPMAIHHVITGAGAGGGGGAGGDDHTHMPNQTHHFQSHAPRSLAPLQRAPSNRTLMGQGSAPLASAASGGGTVHVGSKHWIEEDLL